MQLHTLWAEWVDKTCDEQLVPAVAASLGMEAATPPDDEPSDEETNEAQPGIQDSDILLAGGGTADDVAAVEAAKQRLAVGAPAGP